MGLEARIRKGPPHAMLLQNDTDALDQKPTKRNERRLDRQPPRSYVKVQLKLMRQTGSILRKQQQP